MKPIIQTCPQNIGADALLLTLFSSANVQYCPKLLSISSWSLLKHIQSKLKLEAIHHKDTDLKKEEKEEGLKGEICLLKSHVFVRVVRMCEMEIEIYTDSSNQ